MPPLAVASVPASVTAPVVAVAGVSPVVPAEKDATVLPVVASVPLVGSVNDVLAVAVSVTGNAPEVVRLPALDKAVDCLQAVIIAASQQPRVQLAEGTHHVEVQKNGYRRVSLDVRVRRGETAPVNVALARD